MECNSTTVLHSEDFEKPRIKEESFNQDETITESQIPLIQQNVDSKIEIKQESWHLNDIKSDPEQIPTLNLVSFIDNGDETRIKQCFQQNEIPAESQLDIKEELWWCERTAADSPNEVKASSLENNEAAEGMPLLESQRQYTDTVYTTGSTQLQQNRNSSSLFAKTSTLDKKREEKHICKSCGKVFKFLSNLKKHNLLNKECNFSNCKVKKKHRCETCEKRFEHLNSLKNHVLPHDEERQYKCQICEKSYNQSNDLKIHLLIHDDKNQYNCEICEKSFKHLRLLNKHLIVHDDKRQYKCELCAKSFKYLKGMYNHLLQHGSKRQYNCQTCGKTFKKFQLLKKHLLVHDDKRPYKCQICEKSFRQPTALKTHLLSHIDKRPYKCRICERGFKRSEHLKGHLLTHERVNKNVNLEQNVSSTLDTGNCSSNQPISFKYGWRYTYEDDEDDKGQQLNNVQIIALT